VVGYSNSFANLLVNAENHGGELVNRKLGRSNCWNVAQTLACGAHGKGQPCSGRRCRHPPGIRGRFIPRINRSVGWWSNGTVSPGGNSNSRRRRRRIEIRVVWRCLLKSKDFFDAKRNRRFEWVDWGVCAGRWLELHRGLLSVKY
jgi:hypothetical protein